MVGILGKKIGMTQVYDENNRIIPATVIEAGPCHILQVKTKATDGYDAVQLAFGEKRESLVTKPDAGRYKKAGVKPAYFVKELGVTSIENYKVGQKIEAAVFAKGDFVDVIGTSIGKGFQGGVKRWGWAGGGAGHGSMFHRAVGSIQSGARLGRVTKGHHLPGHMGVDRITVQSLEVLDVMADKNLILVKGCIPGHKNSFVIVKEARKKPKGYVKHKPQAAPTQKKSVKAHVAAAARK